MCVCVCVCVCVLYIHMYMYMYMCVCVCVCVCVYYVYMGICIYQHLLHLLEAATLQPVLCQPILLRHLGALAQGLEVSVLPLRPVLVTCFLFFYLFFSIAQGGVGSIHPTTAPCTCILSCLIHNILHIYVYTYIMCVYVYAT